MALYYTVLALYQKTSKDNIIQLRQVTVILKRFQIVLKLIKKNQVLNEISGTFCLLKKIRELAFFAAKVDEKPSK